MSWTLLRSSCILWLFKASVPHIFVPSLLFSSFGFGFGFGLALVLLWSWSWLLAVINLGALLQVRCLGVLELQTTSHYIAPNVNKVCFNLSISFDSTPSLELGVRISIVTRTVHSIRSKASHEHVTITPYGLHHQGAPLPKSHNIEMLENSAASPTNPHHLTFEAPSHMVYCSIHQPYYHKYAIARLDHNRYDHGN
jgi:hypothetical protein